MSKDNTFEFVLILLAVFAFGILLGGIITKNEERTCIEWETKPTKACSVYKDYIPLGCDMVAELESYYGCSVSACVEGYYCNPEVYCPKYYMCCNFEEECVKWDND